MIASKQKPKTKVRCAIYTRVSTSDQADQEYSSLESQRETAEAYIASQRHAGWECLPERYNDGGYTGANTDRPAFQRLLADIEAGRVDCIICYKLDRLTRSLIDFMKTLEILQRHDVTLVSVTQAFDTSTATGKLMMHILMSFAEFERQLISERTRDKMAAARRKGKYAGGQPVLGYNVVNTKLVIDRTEAKRVRQIFQLYLEHQSLLATANELNARAWTTKCWTTRSDKRRGGSRFHKVNLYNLLTNPVYVGKVRHKDEVYEGEHAAIVDAAVFDAVQEKLARNGTNGGREVRNKHGAILSGILRCSDCDLR